LVNQYYDIATDFYEYGWGRSFHFAIRAEGESLEQSIARHEHYLALKLGLRPGMKVFRYRLWCWWSYDGDCQIQWCQYYWSQQ